MLTQRVDLYPNDKIFVQIPVGNRTTVNVKKYMDSVVDAIHAAFGLNVHVTSLAIHNVDGCPEITVIHRL